MNQETAKSKSLLAAIERDFLPIFRGGDPKDPQPTHETIESIGKNFTAALKGIDEKYLPVPALDNYQLEKAAKEFIKVFVKYKKIIEESPVDAAKGAASTVTKKQDSKFVDDDQQREYLEMMKQVQKFLQHCQGGMENTSMIAEQAKLQKSK